MLEAEAKANNIFLIGGSFPERDGEKLYNTSLSFGPDGAILGKHRKVRAAPSPIAKICLGLAVPNLVHFFAPPFICLFRSFFLSFAEESSCETDRCALLWSRVGSPVRY